MATKNKDERDKPVYIAPATHRRVKAVAAIEGKRLRVFVAETLDAALKERKKPVSA